MAKNYLITGAAGFIGSNFVHFLDNSQPQIDVTVLDKLTYAGNKENLKPVLDKIEFIKGDIADKELVKGILKNIDIVVNFAAESHVDRSIESGEPFVHSNVEGAHNLMEASLEEGIEKFVHISTDEVYGSIEEGKASEKDRLNPSSAYSASKAAADMFANSFYVTHDLPVLIARPTNNYGPNQHKEKLIPKFITNASKGEKLPLYGDGSNVRDWLYVEDTCKAIELLIRKGKSGEVYNIGADNFKTNLEVTETILSQMGKNKDLISFVEDRKGHDQRYAVDSKKIRELGWEPETDFESGIQKTINHYIEGNE